MGDSAMERLTGLSRYSAAKPAVLRAEALSAFRIFGAVAAMVIAAHVRIPLPDTPVPMTLQALVVLLTGYLLPPLSAAVAMVLYLAMGAAGLPVFASTAGLSGLTGGYLMAFPAGAAVVSLLRGSFQASLPQLVWAGLCGMGVIFGIGLGWAAFQLGSVAAAAGAALLPFLPKALVEWALAVSAATLINGRRKSQERSRTVFS